MKKRPCKSSARPPRRLATPTAEASFIATSSLKILFSTRNNVPKLTDFGLVMHYDTDHLTLTQEGHDGRVVYYASPEQVDGRRDIDGRSDVYSLGATLYYALTGHTVYSGSSPQELISKIIKGRFMPPSRYNPRLSHKTLRLLRKMLTVNREKRFQSMEEVIAAIERRL